MFFTCSLDYSEAPSICHDCFRGDIAIQSAPFMAISPVICEVAVWDASKALGLHLTICDTILKKEPLISLQI